MEVFRRLTSRILVVVGCEIVSSRDDCNQDDAGRVLLHNTKCFYAPEVESLKNPAKRANSD